jgi:hypothetical protein
VRYSTAVREERALDLEAAASPQGTPILEWAKIVVDEDAVANLARPALQRQRDQVAESANRHLLIFPADGKYVRATGK